MRVNKLVIMLTVFFFSLLSAFKHGQGYSTLNEANFGLIRRLLSFSCGAS